MSSQMINGETEIGKYDMFRFIVIAFCAFALAACSPSAERQEYDSDDTFGSESHHFHNVDGNSGKQGYSQGAGLRAIAQGSADQASIAVQNQKSAAEQAAYVAKNTLAQAANQASATAQAALAGKQVILQGIEQQLQDAQTALEGEEQQLQQAQRSAAVAQQAAQQAMHHVNVLTAALNAAQATSDQAAQAASEAAGELGAQTAMIGAAKQRVATLAEQLHGARIDYEATLAAAQRALQAAQLAQHNAAEAAAIAASGLNKPPQPLPPPPPPPPISGKGGAGVQVGHNELYSISAEGYSGYHRY
ncbi:mediator of RNA polymerase II transcription subunit 15-like isoform X1 [Agrilus planipennis]|uniref:Mediator of RNA polymerase II transcription subunit 15-like isoform X1 n=2 Tax=Agrilus planipennis TaxID=224129 RepID=A0A1W4WXN7_AGRPL|nr:mediator of RNA polymerase II transcription subunit 15-like isoform X1 [Agrilus planipennis]